MWNEGRYKKEYNDSLDKAVDIFLDQKKAVQAIMDSEGYKVIKAWLKTEMEASMILIMRSANNNEKAKARYEMAKDMLEYFDNLEKVKEK